MKSKYLLLSSLSLILPLAFSFTIISCSNNSSLDNNNNNKPNEGILDSNGGNFNNLEVDKYLAVIKKLNLNQSTIISSLSSQYLTDQLVQSNNEYQNLKIKILDNSSEKNGILLLNLSGSFNGQNYDEIITINNFDHNVSNFEIANIKLDQQQYFDNHQPIVNSNLSLTNDLSIKEKLIENVDFIFNNNSLDFEQMNQKYQLSNIFLENKNNKLSFSFEYSSKFKIYKNGQWILDQNQVNLKNKNNLSIPLFTLKDLMWFMLNQIKLNENTFKDKYASSYKGLFNMSVDLKADQSELLDALDYENIINKYESIYFSNKKIVPQIDINEYDNCKADDYLHTLSFKVNMINFTDNENDLSITKVFESNNFKNINLFLEDNKNNINNITIKNENDSSLAKSIKKIFKNDITNMFNQSIKQTINLNPSDSFISNILNQNWRYVYDFESKEKNIDYLDRINKSYDLSIFNQQVIDYGSLQGNFSYGQASFDIDSGLFQNNENERIMMNNIYFEFDKNNINMSLSMTDNPNFVSLIFYGNMKLTISNKEFVQQTKFTLRITKSSWNN